MLCRSLKICDGNMQEGSFRCDANISVRVEGDSELGTRAELKNINSFRFIERALNHEFQRQIDLIEDGGQVAQETRLYDPQMDQTRPMRRKEEAHDYRYFPDPDLPPLLIEDAELENLRSSLPELPDARCDRCVGTYQLGRSDIQQLTADPGNADYFEATVRAAAGNSKSAANWVTGDLMAALNRDGLPIEQSQVSPTALGRLICRIDDQSISGKIAKDIFSDLWENGGDVDQIIEARGLKQISDSAELEQVIEKILSKFREQADQVRQGDRKSVV